MIRSVQSRIIVLFSALLIGVQGVTLLAIYVVSEQAVIQQLEENLQYAERTFDRLINQRGEHIASEARILVADFGFRSTVSTGDAATIVSALDNLAQRIRGQRAFYLNLDGAIVADTAGRQQGMAFAFTDALDAAEADGKAVVFGVLDGKLYEWVVVPVLAPLPIGWVCIASAVDGNVVERFKRLSPANLDISVVAERQVLASSLPPPRRQALAAALATAGDSLAPLAEMALGGRRYITQVHPLAAAEPAQPVAAVLQTDLRQALRPYRMLLYAVAGLLLLTLALGLGGAYLLARNIARPLRELDGATRRMMDGAAAETIAVTRDDELGRLAATFNRASVIAAQMATLQQQEQMRRELVASVSHDLRSPLTSLHGFLQTMRQHGNRLPPEEQQRFLDVALRQSEKIGRLAQEMFELAKLECDGTSLQAETFCLAELVQDVAQKYALLAQQRGVRLLPQLRGDLPPVVADIALIERVLANLLDNALRHTPAGGEVRVELHTDGQWLHISVADTGSGIAPDYLPTLFAVGSPLARRADGGLGLLIVSKIIALHGGRIHADSVLGQGTVLRFTLPLAQP